MLSVSGAFTDHVVGIFPIVGGGSYRRWRVECGCGWTGGDGVHNPGFEWGKEADALVAAGHHVNANATLTEVTVRCREADVGKVYDALRNLSDVNLMVERP